MADGLPVRRRLGPVPHRKLSCIELRIEQFGHRVDGRGLEDIVVVRVNLVDGDAAEDDGAPTQGGIGVGFVRPLLSPEYRDLTIVWLRDEFARRSQTGVADAVQILLKIVTAGIRG